MKFLIMLLLSTCLSANPDYADLGRSVLSDSLHLKEEIDDHYTKENKLIDSSFSYTDLNKKDLFEKQEHGDENDAESNEGFAFDSLEPIEDLGEEASTSSIKKTNDQRFAGHGFKKLLKNYKTDDSLRDPKKKNSLLINKIHTVVGENRRNNQNDLGAKKLTDDGSMTEEDSDQHNWWVHTEFSEEPVTDQDDAVDEEMFTMPLPDHVTESSFFQHESDTEEQDEEFDGDAEYKESEGDDEQRTGRIVNTAGSRRRVNSGGAQRIRASNRPRRPVVGIEPTTTIYHQNPVHHSIRPSTVSVLRPMSTVHHHHSPINPYRNEDDDVHIEVDSCSSKQDCDRKIEINVHINEAEDHHSKSVSEYDELRNKQKTNQQEGGLLGKLFGMLG